MLQNKSSGISISIRIITIIPCLALVVLGWSVSFWTVSLLEVIYNRPFVWVILNVFFGFVAIPLKLSIENCLKIIGLSRSPRLVFFCLRKLQHIIFILKWGSTEVNCAGKCFVIRKNFKIVIAVSLVSSSFLFAKFFQVVPISWIHAIRSLL